MTNDPVLIAYAVKRTKQGRGVWTRIGRAYPHEAGSGLTVVLDVLPRDGRIVLLEPNEKIEGDAAAWNPPGEVHT